MIKFSTFSLSGTSLPSEPIARSGLTSLFIVAPGPGSLRPGGGRPRLGDAHPLGPFTALPLPAVDRVAQLEEGDDARRDGQPEGDHAVGQHRREDLGAGKPEEDE